MKDMFSTGNAIGIGSNIGECTTDKWWYQMKGYKYWWQCDQRVLSNKDISQKGKQMI